MSNCTLKCFQLNYFLKISRKSIPPNPMQIKLNSVIYAQHDNADGMYYITPLHYLKNYTSMFEHGFYL